jgi:predicted MFS family arabinose efflux permease
MADRYGRLALDIPRQYSSAVGAIALALAFVRDAPTGEKRQPLDIQGGALATLALGGVILGPDDRVGPIGMDERRPCFLRCRICSAHCFRLGEKIRGENAMMPLALFGSSSFIGLTLLTLLLYGALGGLVVLLPYVLIRAAAYSATTAGATLLPFAVVLTLTSPLMGGLAGRVGSRAPLSLGSLAVAAGFLLILRIGPEAKYWTSVLPALLVIAFGMAGAVAPLTTAVLASVDARHTGSASGLNSAVARTGGLVATALLGGVLSAAGPHLIEGFHIAAIGALASVGAAAAAFLLVKDAPRPA